MLKVKAQAYSVEAADVRNEWTTVWEEVKFPDGKIYIPGVIAHKTTTIEPPELWPTVSCDTRKSWAARTSSRHGLWLWEPSVPRHRLGQNASHGGRGGPGYPAALATHQLSGWFHLRMGAWSGRVSETTHALRRGRAKQTRRLTDAYPGHSDTRL